MFIVNVTYKKPLPEIDKHLNAHREFLDKFYKEGLFAMSGPQKPRTGGIILARTESLETLKQAITEDPFFKYEIADYAFTEFSPNKYQIDTILESLI